MVLVANDNWRVETPRFTCPCTVLSLATSPAYSLGSSFRDYSTSTTKLSCLLPALLHL